MEWQPFCSHPLPPTTRTIGAEAEQAACQFLEQSGCTLICRNYHSRRGEIDLIMREGDRLLFVEVRLRRNDAFGGKIGRASCRERV